jgi:hypothetical protein
MKSHVTLEEMTRANWVMVAVLGVLAVVLLILAQMMGEIAARTNSSGVSAQVDSR